MKKRSFWDVSHLHEEEFRATFDDKDFAKVFYQWGFGIPELSLAWYNRRRSVGHEILDVKSRRDQHEPRS